MRSREEIRTREKANRDYYRKRGICIKCGKEPALETHTRCLECSYKAWLSSRKYQLSHKAPEDKLKASQAQKDLREKRRAAGVCPYCGRLHNDKKYAMCAECRLKSNRRQKERRRRIRKASEGG